MITPAIISTDYNSTRTVIREEQSSNEYDGLIKKPSGNNTESRPLAGSFSSTILPNSFATPSSVNNSPAKQDSKFKVLGTTSSVASRIVFDAYTTKVQQFLTEWTEWETNYTSGSPNITVAGKIVRLSEKYLKSLNNYASYRIFISSVSMSVKNSLGIMDNRKLILFKKAISEYQGSEQVKSDTQKFVKTITGFGISPLKVDV
jgi:hypothetical protein